MAVTFVTLKPLCGSFDASELAQMRRVVLVETPCTLARRPTLSRTLGIKTTVVDGTRGKDELPLVGLRGVQWLQVRGVGDSRGVVGGENWRGVPLMVHLWLRT